METMNGYVIVADIPDPYWKEARIILGVREDEYGKEYVTAQAFVRELEPSEWTSGHYFRNDIVGAVEDWQARANR